MASADKPCGEAEGHVTALQQLFCFGIRAHLCRRYLLHHVLLYQLMLVLFWSFLHQTPLTPAGFFFFLHLSCRAHNNIKEYSVSLSSAKKS